MVTHALPDAQGTPDVLSTNVAQNTTSGIPNSHIYIDSILRFESVSNLTFVALNTQKPLPPSEKDDILRTS
jgi:hypothetical protein